MTLVVRWLTVLAALTIGSTALAFNRDRSLRIGYVSSHEAALTIDGEPALDLELAPATEAALIERVGETAGPVYTYHLHGLHPNTAYTIGLETAIGRRTPIQFKTPPLPTLSGSDSSPLRLQITGAIPANASRSDLELVAAGLQTYDAIATISIGGLFALAEGEEQTAEGYLYAARRLIGDAIWQGHWGRGAHYGVLGANDYGPIGATRYWSNRRAVLDAFAKTWPTPNQPFSGTPTVYEFSCGDVACFVLDGFSLSEGVESPTAKRSILGQPQHEWLANALALSPATFKLILCGRPLLVPVKDGFSLHGFEEATRAILEVLDGPGTEGIILITGGGQNGELTRIIRPSGYPIYELSVGPLARFQSHEATEPLLNYFRVPGTLVREPHFARLEVTGPTTKRTLRISMHQSDGTELWTETLLAEDLKD